MLKRARGTLLAASLAASVGIALGFSAVACIEEGAREGDVVGDTTGPTCRVDGDCTKFANGCNTSACVNNTCTSEPVVCDDENVCTDDRCDAEVGCVFDPRPPGSECLVGTSATCVGVSWHAPDACDDGGHCVDGGVEDCLVDVGTGTKCTHRECVPGSGCGIVADNDGTSCVEGGRSDICLDGVRYEADTCQGGQCVEAGQTACPVAFCEAPTCSGRGCGSAPIGVDIDITGGWNLLTLASDATGHIASARIRLELQGAGEVTVQGAFGPPTTTAPTDGAYCVTTDGKLQLSLRTPGQGELVFAGRLARGRDLAVLTSEGVAGVAVLVRNRELSEAKLFGGTYRVIGLDNLVSDAGSQIDALLGTIAFSDGCVTGGSYSVANGAVVQLALPNPPSCIAYSGGNAIELDVRALGDVRHWIGVVGTGGHYAVMQRFRVGEQVIEPSLVFLVRTGLAQPFALEGEYTRARIGLDEGSRLSLVKSTIGFDGLGRVTSWSEGDVALGAADVASVTMSTSDPISAFLLTLRIGALTRQRTGQAGTSTSGKVDWTVDVGTTPDGGLLGPVDGRTLQLGVRAP